VVRIGAVTVDHYENFPVASLLCPPALRPAVRAIYQFARTADDIADEGEASPADRLAELQSYRSDLDAVLEGREPGPHWRRVLGPLGERARQFKLPASLLHDLLDAFEQDVRNPPYPDRPTLLDYCRRSANPIGRLLLHLYGIADARSIQQSDAICSALQLINFWQDLSVDGPRGRCYVPQDDAITHRVTPDELVQGVDSRRSRLLVGALCAWARTLMTQGAPLALRIPGRAGWELRLVVQGGLRVLEKIALLDHAVLSHRPKLTITDVPLLLWRAWRMPWQP
jgi:hydroxysqualene synthase